MNTRKQRIGRWEGRKEGSEEGRGGERKMGWREGRRRGGREVGKEGRKEHKLAAETLMEFEGVSALVCCDCARGPAERRINCKIRREWVPVGGEGCIEEILPLVGGGKNAVGERSIIILSMARRNNAVGGGERVPLARRRIVVVGDKKEYRWFE